MKILITRPSPQGEKLVNALNNIGIIAYHFSLFNFIFNNDERGLSKNINQLYQADKIIIFSQKAIYYTHLYLKSKNLNWPSKPKYYTIGKSTGLLLQKYIKKKFLYHKNKKIVNLY
ncbi:uroporphyrinogen-III synthase [Buchnera aphidicola]|uniref:uroporphyrinogen-III synthase n=1 Tax=Buchnera aphidicola TaxID=9 RepID=UPI003BEF29D9